MWRDMVWCDAVVRGSGLGSGLGSGSGAETARTGDAIPDGLKRGAYSPQNDARQFGSVYYGMKCRGIGDLLVQADNTGCECLDAAGAWE